MASSLGQAERPLISAVVGTGAISNEHLSFLAGRTAAGDVSAMADLRAVCDLSPAAGRYAAATFGAAASYTDLEEMLEVEKPDVVHVLTPPATHLALATMCLEAGANVICEKPITINRSDLENLLATAERCNRQIMESHNYRFNSAIGEISAAIAAGELGTVREVTIRIALPITDPEGRFGDPNLPSLLHCLPAGVIHDFTTHFSYLLIHLAPGVVYDRVAAAWSRHGDNELFSVDDLDALLVGEGPNGAVHARLRFDARSAPDTFTVTVRGSVGLAETDLFHPYLRMVRPRLGGSKLSPIVNNLVNGSSLVKSGVRNLGHKLLQQGPYEGLHKMLDLTYRALVAGVEMPVSPEDMLAASALVDSLLDDKAAL
ncbi:MAG: Gfo/Idh/MocA family oxidoreductase [Actinomycetia bacterium]|nr:Gfo/Idh/MocA family oxidoreductase [Actinomycetes bacterium]MCP4223902.1 Gfo/Idh/MocA family oxidoreductase [Actinomycetes bacterium]MCP5035413.1 Gfo/Idh/MocA family oxidoreductase [Actinomycetes bacterium]